MALTGGEGGNTQELECDGCHPERDRRDDRDRVLLQLLVSLVWNRRGLNPPFSAWCAPLGAHLFFCRPPFWRRPMEPRRLRADGKHSLASPAVSAVRRPPLRQLPPAGATSSSRFPIDRKPFPALIERLERDVLRLVHRHISKGRASHRSDDRFERFAARDKRAKL